MHYFCQEKWCKHSWCNDEDTWTRMEPNGACLGKAVLPATSLLGLRPTSGLWSTVGIDVSVHFRLFVNTDLVMLLLYWTRLIQIACARFGYYSLCFTHSSNDNNSYKKNLADWLTGIKKVYFCTCNTFQALLPYYRYSYTSERSDDVFAYIHIVRICKVRIKYIMMILSTFEENFNLKIPETSDKFRYVFWQNDI